MNDQRQIFAQVKCKAYEHWPNGPKRWFGTFVDMVYWVGRQRILSLIAPLISSLLCLSARCQTHFVITGDSYFTISAAFDHQIFTDHPTALFPYTYTYMYTVFIYRFSCCYIWFFCSFIELSYWIYDCFFCYYWSLLY